MKRFLQILTAIAALVSFSTHAEVISSKGTPIISLPSGCKVVPGGTLVGFLLKSYEFPQLNHVELLACDDLESKKKYFRLRLAVLVKSATGKLENQVADEAIIPWHSNVYLEGLSVAEADKCTSADIGHTEFGPYAIGMWVQENNGDLLLKDILVAWTVDKPSKTITIIGSKKISCRATGD